MDFKGSFETTSIWKCSVQLACIFIILKAALLVMVTFSVGLLICFFCPEDQNERRVMFNLPATQH